jgi:hypothetical protein
VKFSLFFGMLQISAYEVWSPHARVTDKALFRITRWWMDPWLYSVMSLAYHWSAVEEAQGNCACKFQYKSREGDTNWWRDGNVDNNWQ